MKAINKYEPREVPFAAWIMRVARNASLDHLRARRAVPTEEVRLTDSGQAQMGTSVVAIFALRSRSCPKISARYSSSDTSPALAG